MNSLIFDEIVGFSLEDENYTELIINNTKCYETYRGKINHQRVILDLEKFSFGYISISKFIPYRRLHREEYISSLYGRQDESSSSEDENADIDYDKIIVNGFILCTINYNEDTDEFTLNIDILCGREDHKGLGAELLKKALDYCIEEEIKFCELEAPYYELIEYYQRFGFVFVRRELDDYHMIRKNY